MTTIRASRAAGTVPLLLMLLAAGCADAGAGSGSGDGRDAGAGGAAATGTPSALAGLVLRVRQTGGVTTGATDLGVPSLSVYDDGRVIEPGPVTAIYPGQALPNILVRRLQPAGVSALGDRARTAHLGEPGFDYGRPPIADATTTSITLVEDGEATTTEVYALAEADAPARGLTAEQVRARAAVRDLLSALSEIGGAGAPATALPWVAGDEPTQYRPAALIALARPWTPASDLPDQPEIAWPGPALPGDPVATGRGRATSCLRVDGTRAQAVLTAAAKANTLTPWTSGGKRWTVTIRPLLPDESGCVALRGASLPASPVTG